MTRTSTTSISVASVEAIRARFPALTRRYEELPVAYFDGPGGTQVPDLVVDRMTDYLLHHNANTHWHFPTSLETDAALDGARPSPAAVLHRRCFAAEEFDVAAIDIIFGVRSGRRLSAHYPPFPLAGFVDFCFRSA